MYNILLPSGTTLDLAPGTQLGFELQNSIFSNSDTSALPGSFTFPLDLPASPTNRVALGFPENVHTPGSPSPIEGVWVLAAGHAMFYGTLTVRSANRSRIQVSIVANPMASIKDVKLNELDLGADVPFNQSPLVVAAVMQDTIEHPLDYNYAFLPVYNYTFYSGHAPGTFAANFYKAQNEYDATTDAFEVADDVPIMPMVRLDYVLRQLVETSAEGWAFVNDLQFTDEMKLLYLWNNYDLWEAENGDVAKELAETFNLRNHVSDTKGGELLRKVASLFNTGVFVNPFNRTIKLRPLQDVLAQPARHDWTAYAVEGSNIEYEDGADIDKYRHLTMSLPAVSSISPRTLPETYNLTETLGELTSFANDAEYQTAEAGLPNGLYYIEDLAILKLKETIGAGPATQSLTIGYQKRVYEYKPGDDYYEPRMQVPFRRADSVRWDAAGNYVEVDDADENTWKRTGSKPEDVLFFYRGMQPNITDYTVPYCTDTDAPPDETAAPGSIYPEGTATDPCQYSLRWNGERGLYATRFALWHEMAANGKPVAMQLTLPVTLLTAFSFEDKVRIGQMDYFVKSLRITKLTADGYFLIDAKLFTTI